MNKEEFLKMANRTHQKYEEEESSEFIKKVMSANSDEISKAGYFYKLLMASADDFRIIEDDCGSNGTEFDINELNEDNYNYYVKSMFVTELGENSNMDFDQFKEKIEKDEVLSEKIKNNKIHVLNPASCKCREKHGICRKCAGEIPSGIENIGTFTALCVTEHVTQNCLSSMNKGVKQNINDLLLIKYDREEYNWNSIDKWISEVVDKLENDEVQARYYQIALLSRVRYDGDEPFVASMKSSINYSGNIFGQYIFTPNMRNFEKIIREKEFEDDSIKLQIAINNYEK